LYFYSVAKNVVTDRIKRFIAPLPPFNTLEEADLNHLVSKVSVSYREEGEILFTEGDAGLPDFYCVRQGSIRIENKAGELLDLCDEGDVFGTRPLLGEEPYLASGICAEPCILYAFPVSLAKEIMRENAGMALYFATGLASGRPMPTRNKQFRETEKSALNEVNPVRVTKKLIHTTKTTTIRQAAILMDQARVGSMVITDALQRPVGIITDKDLRKHVVARGVSSDNPCSAIMSAPVATIPEGISQAECLIEMIRLNVHHLVVTTTGKADATAIGMVTEHDLLLTEQSHPAVLLKEMRRTKDLRQLVTLRNRADELIAGYIRQEVSVMYSSSIITSITDVLVHQCILRAFNTYGHPPCSFAFLGLGSHGRGEQLLRTDQDHALLYEDGYPEAKAYFLKLAEHVSMDLEKAGFEFDKAGISAASEKWCLSLSEWQALFSQWLNTPHQDNVLLTTIFLDYRVVYGSHTLSDALTQYFYEGLNNHSGLLTFMAKDATETPPPLSFFRNWVVERSGEHQDAFDLKLRVSLPLVDVGRVLALQHRLTKENNTIVRFLKAADAEPGNAALYREAASAYAFVLYLRARFGLNQNDSGRYIRLEALNKLERQTLRNVFEIVKELQSILRVRFQLDYLR
jgi:CBS domain-containing protein